jgi:MEKHLA domain-containing protein
VKTLDIEPWSLQSTLLHTRRLRLRFRRWTGRELYPDGGSRENDARFLFKAPFVVVAHGVESDSILNYGNRAALILWERDWDLSPACHRD